MVSDIFLFVAVHLAIAVSTWTALSRAWKWVNSKFREFMAVDRRSRRSKCQDTTRDALAEFEEWIASIETRYARSISNCTQSCTLLEPSGIRVVGSVVRQTPYEKAPMYPSAEMQCHHEPETAQLSHKNSLMIDSSASRECHTATQVRKVDQSNCTAMQLELETMELISKHSAELEALLLGKFAAAQRFANELTRLRQHLDAAESYFASRDKTLKALAAREAECQKYQAEIRALRVEHATLKLAVTEITAKARETQKNILSPNNEAFDILASNQLVVKEQEILSEGNKSNTAVQAGPPANMEIQATADTAVMNYDQKAAPRRRGRLCLDTIVARTALDRKRDDVV
ncbi:hypothetical protein HDU83_003405 [Entophlyctis luteolus]|nr:hypothetical protein HDU83_003405 [Entophlyctis luteolus]